MSMSLYIHIPYCKRRCLYCDFCSTTDAGALTGYIKTLRREYDLLIAAHPVEGPFKTVFIGGGTPTALLDADFQELMDFVHSLPKTADYEWTVEANPESLSLAKLEMMRAAGCNRLSIGVQDLNEQILRTIGRLHSAEDFIGAFNQARQLGFNNISVDLMFGIPGQTLTGFEATLNAIVKLAPEHLSTYGLKIEEGTAMENLVNSGLLVPMTEEDDRALYHMIKQTLKDNGYNHYELSNFSKPGRESRHNLSYWHNESFLGLGLGSSYYISGTRYENVHDLDVYLQNITDGRLPILTAETNGLDTERYETLFLQLRLAEGLDIDRFSQRYGIDFESLYGQVVKGLIEARLLARMGQKLYLTELGKDLSNQVFVDLMI